MNWDEYFIGFARHASLKSKDTTKVGAILVDSKNSVILTGFNGPPRGVVDSPDRFERPVKYLYASHAEANLISFAARLGIRTEGCKVYATHMPCASCTRTLIQAGIRSIVYGDGTFQALEDEAPHCRMMCKEAGVEHTKYSRLKFEYPLTNEEEYWLGYLRADGHLLKRGSSCNILFSQKHEYPVKEFSKFADSPGGVKFVRRETTFGRQEIYTCSSSVEIGNQIYRLGLKSEGLAELLFHSIHFWRGMIDGDGTILPEHGPSLSLVGNCFDVELFASFIEEILGKKPSVRQVGKKKSNIFDVRLKGNMAKALVHELYQDNYSALPYKKFKAEQIMKAPYKTHKNAWRPPCAN